MTRSWREDADGGSGGRFHVCRFKLLVLELRPVQQPTARTTDKVPGADPVVRAVCSRFQQIYGHGRCNLQK